ncbi:hypothetical protein V2J09_012533 [Rumex salicifolius]
MKSQIKRGFNFSHAIAPAPPLRSSHLRRRFVSTAKEFLQSPEDHASRPNPASIRHRVVLCCSENGRNPMEKLKRVGDIRRTRRDVIVGSFATFGAVFLGSTSGRSEEIPAKSDAVSPPPAAKVEATETVPTPAVKVEAKEETLASRIYDATVIGEPLAVGKDKSKVWEKLMNARVVYLGEAEQVPTREDKVLELEIVKNLRRKCVESERPLSVALEGFPSDLQEQVNKYMDKRIDADTLKSFMTHWPPERWQEYEPLLNYCRDNGVRLVACGTPLQVLRTVQSEGIRGLSKSDRQKYAPPAGSGFISGTNPLSRRLSLDTISSNQITTYGPSSYLTVQSRVVEDYSMSQVVLQALADGGGSGLLVVITGANHVLYGSRGTGIPARISRKLQKKNQVVLLLDPERQFIRREGEVPVADFLCYSPARPCSRNCFDRAEIARVMNAAGRRRDALPQDLQKGLDLGLVSPEVLQNFFDLEQYPLIKELTSRFQGFRERLLADPKFLNRLAIEEAISITTSLVAQYEKRKGNFFQELDYVVTDLFRGAVVDFFTVWLPAPTLSFLSFGDGIENPENLDSLIGLLGSIPDNAFQTNPAGKNWTVNHRIASVLVGGVKLASVGFVSSLGAVVASNALFAARRILNPELVTNQKYKRSPILKTAAVYSGFLGTSANLRYQVIAGLIEHRISELIPSQTLLVNGISFVARTVNSYWGTQQWIDLARYTGIQTQKSETELPEADPETATLPTIECNTIEEGPIDDIKNQ